MPVVADYHMGQLEPEVFRETGQLADVLIEKAHAQDNVPEQAALVGEIYTGTEAVFFHFTYVVEQRAGN
ncbi:MAG: hypothetical protein A4E55_01891 [Pelotomaculum sp. PtaU1.Bin035]|nr:MAG: hypothetical protein A4E55_01891 [Pelotomaculum sp. PtaU1.Bin035]